MKLLLLLSFLTIAFTSFSQVDSLANQKLLNAIDAYKFNSRKEALKSFLQKMDLANVQKMQPGIYALKQDNMPCVVPETKAIAAIPNESVVSLPFNTTMPNLAQKQTVK